jgi:hypothetical protein
MQSARAAPADAAARAPEPVRARPPAAAAETHAVCTDTQQRELAARAVRLLHRGSLRPFKKHTKGPI